MSSGFGNENLMIGFFLGSDEESGPYMSINQRRTQGGVVDNIGRNKRSRKETALGQNSIMGRTTGNNG